MLRRVLGGPEATARRYRPPAIGKPPGEISHISINRLDPSTEPKATDKSGQKVDSLPSSVDQQTTDVVTDHGHDESG